MKSKRRYPSTINAALEYLISSFDPDTLQEIASMAYGDLGSVYRSYGLLIRNSLGLWGQNPTLLNSLPETERFADNASWFLIEALWKRLNPEEAAKWQALTAIRPEWQDFVLFPKTNLIHTYAQRIDLSQAVDQNVIAENGWDQALHPYVIYRSDIDQPPEDSFEAMQVDKNGNVTIWTTKRLWSIRGNAQLSEELHWEWRSNNHGTEPSL